MVVDDSAEARPASNCAERAWRREPRACRPVPQRAGCAAKTLRMTTLPDDVISAFESAGLRGDHTGRAAGDVALNHADLPVRSRIRLGVCCAGVSSARTTIDQTAASIGRFATRGPTSQARKPPAGATIGGRARHPTRVAAVGRLAGAAALVDARATAELRVRARAALDVAAAAVADGAAIVHEPFCLTPARAAGSSSMRIARRRQLRGRRAGGLGCRATRAHADDEGVRLQHQVRVSVRCIREGDRP